jgi:hypothetical protein
MREGIATAISMATNTQAPAYEKLRLTGNECPTVDVFITCCGEDDEVVLDTVRGACDHLFTGHVNNVRVVHSELIAGSLESGRLGVVQDDDMVWSKSTFCLVVLASSWPPWMLIW